MKYLVISDVHLGHKKTKTEYILSNLEGYLTRDLLKDVDVLFIAGDFFDRLLSLQSNEAYLIISYIRSLFKLLHTTGTMLRVLMGTPSHDWRQNELFNSIYSCMNDKYPVNFRYIDNLYLEDILGYKVLYIPDEYKPTADLVYKDVKELLDSKMLKKVDLIIMHGMFSFQIPTAVKSPLIHDEAKYLSICKYYIHPGHIHERKTFDRIYAQGSFDRLMHNDESPKGGYLCEIGDKLVEPIFVENKKAKKYITINVSHKTTDEIISRLSKLYAKLDSGSYIRLKTNIDSDAVVYFKKLQKRFTEFELSLKVVNNKEAKEVQQQTYTPIAITRDNIAELLKNIYGKRENIDTTDIPKIDKFLEEILNEL